MLDVCRKIHGAMECWAKPVSWPRKSPISCTSVNLGHVIRPFFYGADAASLSVGFRGGMNHFGRELAKAPTMQLVYAISFFSLFDSLTGL